ncbi:hypothetical protein [uncultured Roseobacter sp.]|uniref:hypothetical protein n=1 Tax=uncultured Roseobacter sp. TaxID=114847 RepID=UPI0026145D31|nr:hypothetical protein [uncultured Roseobacter sp.]
MSDLDARLLAAHAADDRSALIALYAQAADEAAEEDARAFYLTHAYVFALEAGSPQAEILRDRLVALGREPPAQAVVDNCR